MSTTLRLEAESRFPYLLTSGRDHKAWAKRILYRESRGDKTLSALQVSFAKTAMGVVEESSTSHNN